MENSLDEKLDQIDGTLRRIVGALNSGSGSSDITRVVERLSTLEADMKHLQGSMKDIKTALWGLAASVLGLVAKMVLEGALK